MCDGGGCDAVFARAAVVRAAEGRVAVGRVVFIGHCPHLARIHLGRIHLGRIQLGRIQLGGITLGGSPWGDHLRSMCPVPRGPPQPPPAPPLPGGSLIRTAGCISSCRHALTTTARQGSISRTVFGRRKRRNSTAIGRTLPYPSPTHYACPGTAPHCGWGVHGPLIGRGRHTDVQCAPRAASASRSVLLGRHRREIQLLGG